jgi:PAS domain S-box-containing protein
MYDFFDFSNEMLCVADHRGYFVRVNAAWTETLGWSAEELTSRPFIEFVHPDDVAATRREAELLHGGGHETIWFENRYRTTGGTYRWLSWKVRFAPESRELVATARDVTDQKRQAEALQASEERFRRLATHGPVGIVASDPQGNCTFANPRWLQLTGLTLEQALGEGWKSAIHPDDLARITENWYAAVLADREYADETRFLKPTGEIVWVYFFSVAVKNEEGITQSYIGTVVDITEQKRTYDALKEERELLRNMIEVQEQERRFLSNEFHDGLIQYAVASLMSLENLRESLPPKAATAVDSVIENLRRGIDDGRRAIRGIRPAVLDDAGIAEALEDLVGQFSQSGMMVTCSCDPAIGRLSNTLQTTLYRVVQEALNNARKHADTDVVRITLKKLDDELHLEVRDFGKGFDLTAARGKGFGLRGMSERVRLLGGECVIRSEPDVGTTVSARLPLADAGG